MLVKLIEKICWNLKIDALWTLYLNSSEILFDQASFIKFVYTDSIEISKITPGVLQVADKYQVLGLLKKCCCHLADNISTANAIELFLLAYFVSAASELKTSAMKFIVDHYLELKEATPGQMAVLVEQHPKAFQEIFECQHNSINIIEVKRESEWKNAENSLSKLIQNLSWNVDVQLQKSIFSLT